MAAGAEVRLDLAAGEVGLGQVEGRFLLGARGPGATGLSGASAPAAGAGLPRGGLPPGLLELGEAIGVIELASAG
jgi:hypothetical protein